MSEADDARLAELLAISLQVIPAAVLVFDPDRRPIWINDAMERLLSNGAELLDGLDVIFDPAQLDDETELGRAMRAASAGIATRIDRVTFDRSDGTIEREAWIGPIPSAADSEDGAQGIVLIVPAEEERLHPLLANTYDIISVLDRDGTIRYSNPAAGRLSGYDGQVLAGTSAIDLVHPDDQAVVLEMLADPTIMADEPLRLRLRFGDNTWHHCLVHVADLLDDPAVRGVVVTVHDVTEQVQAHEELSRSERWVHQLLANITDVVVIFDESGKITYASPSIERLTGIPEAIHPGTNAFEDVHADDLAPVLAVFDSLHRHPASEQRVTFRLRHAEGHYVWVEALAVNCLDDPAVDGIIATIRDVTELKQAEELFRGLVDAAPDAMVVVDEGGRVVLANDRAQDLFGWPTDDLIGQPVEVLVPDTLRARHVGHRASFADAPRRRVMGEGLELVARRRDGSDVPVEVSLSTHETHQGRLISAAIRDITAQRETRRALESALEKEQEVVRRLEQADALKAEFVSTVAHELRNPLSAITGFARVLEGQLREVGPPQALMMASRISANANRLLDMIGQLLRFSRLEAGEAALSKTEVELASVIDQSIELLGAGLGDHQLQIDVAAGLTVWADREGIANVLRNLVGNAAKFGPPGSTIWIDAEASDGVISMSVSDEGPGVPPEQRETVFEQFHQTKEGREQGGTGLGLSIARRYVELHDGEIWVDEHPGGGARFTFTIPRTGQQG